MKNKLGLEIEVKFYVTSLPEVERKVQELGGLIVQERVFESNLRYDTADRSLSKERRVLRLRKDHQTILTYKGAAEADKPVSVRQEFEVIVDDLDSAGAILAALGYEVITRYEKYRSIYRLMGTLVTLDELPYGKFVEIEGESADEIQKVARNLNLSWKERIASSYILLFENLKKNHVGWEDKSLTFEDLAGVEVMPDELGVCPADIG